MDMTGKILHSYFRKIKYAGLWKKVFMTSGDSKFKSIMYGTTTRNGEPVLCSMKNLTRPTAQRFERALDRLRQRYGVSGGFTSEPNMIAIRNGPKMSFDLNSLKMFNEDLNTLEVFAFSHDEAEKFSGQLLLDTASRLPTLLK